MARRPKPVRHLLRDRPVLNRLEQEVSEQKALLNLVRQCLPDDLAAHCVGARINDRQLVLHADSPVWASRLRYLAKQLLSVLDRPYPDLREIKVRLLVTDTTRPKRRKPALKSNRAAAIIHDQATYTQAEPLKAALLRLSRALKDEKSNS